MRKRFVRYAIRLLICVCLASPAVLFAQGTPLTRGPLTVTIPAGWTGQTSAEPARFFSPDSTPQQYFSVEFFSPQTISDQLVAHHNMIVNNLSGLMEPGTQPQTGLLGQFIFTRIIIRRPGSQPETLILYSAQVGSQYVSLDVDATSSDLVAKDLPVVEAMIRSAILGAAASAPAYSAPAPAAAGYPPAAPANSGYAPSGAPAYGQPAGNNYAPQAQPVQEAQMPTGPASLSEYVYTVPPGWSPMQYPDGIVVTSPASQTGEHCQISMWPMRPTTGNIGNDAIAAFRDVFKAYEARSKTSDGMPVPTTIIRGTSGAGWDYLIVKQGIGIRGPYETMMGSVMVANLNGTIAVVSTIAKQPLISSCLGELISDAWPKFFYQLGFKSWVPTNQAAVGQKILGVWNIATATVADQFTFSPNGRYGGASASQNYDLMASGTVLTTTQGFFGDGAYTLNGNAITLTPDNHNKPTEQGWIRVEQETTDGGKTWTPYLYLLRTSSVDGKEYEVRYHKTK